MHNTQSTQLLFELSKPGCRAVRLPACDVPQKPLDDLLPAEAMSDTPLPLPELSEPDVVRHFVNLSTQELLGRYPLLSARLLYDEVQPQAERAAGRPAGHGRPAPLSAGIDPPGNAGPAAPWRSTILAEIAGLPAVSLQPAAGRTAK